jgi:hypothetical protein
LKSVPRRKIRRKQIEHSCKWRNFINVLFAKLMRMVKPMRKRLASNEARMGGRKMHTGHCQET